MTQLVFHHKHKRLPPAAKNTFPVQLYGLSGQGRGDISVIGNPVIEKVKRLGKRLSSQVMDFLTISLAVTAADTFVRRNKSADGWTRQLSIQLPVHDPDRWQPLKRDLQTALHFLSGDIWEFKFLEDGVPPPAPYRSRNGFKLISLRDIDCVCLFSGGLDSAIGVIDLLDEGRSPLFVSHAYKGDKSLQDRIASSLIGRYSRFSANANPVSANRENDITMRTRSLNFLAFGAVGACAVQAINQQDKVDLIVPENGFISLNAPLTSRRIGSLSTRTTHPYFVEFIQKIFDAAEIPCHITNPYQFQTKGEMIEKCRNRQLLADIVDNTVSCSHWKRTNQQCGVCVPCIIRRAALYAGEVSELNEYAFEDLSNVLKETDRRDDLFAMSIAVTQMSKRNLGIWISDSGPLPPSQFIDFQNVFSRGLKEVEVFLKYEGVM